MCFLELKLPASPERDGLIVEVRHGEGDWESIALASSGETFIEGRDIPMSPAGTRTRVFAVYCDFRSKRLAPVFPEAGKYELRIKWYSIVGVYPPVQPDILMTSIVAKKMSVANRLLFENAAELDWKSFDMGQPDTPDLSALNKGWMATSYLVASAHQGWNPQKLESQVSALSDIANQSADSEYAPYFAYLSGLARIARKERLAPESTLPLSLPNKQLAEVPAYKAALKSLEVASQSDDPLLAPKATCKLAVLKSWTGNFEPNLAELDRLSAEHPDQPEVAEAIENARRSISVLRERQDLQRRHESQE
jgi:hypothetical protein